MLKFTAENTAREAVIDLGELTADVLDGKTVVATYTAPTRLEFLAGLNEFLVKNGLEMWRRPVRL